MELHLLSYDFGKKPHQICFSSTLNLCGPVFTSPLVLMSFSTRAHRNLSRYQSQFSKGFYEFQKDDGLICECGSALMKYFHVISHLWVSEMLTSTISSWERTSSTSCAVSFPFTWAYTHEPKKYSMSHTLLKIDWQGTVGASSFNDLPIKAVPFRTYK